MSTAQSFSSELRKTSWSQLKQIVPSSLTTSMCCYFCSVTIYIEGVINKRINNIISDLAHVQTFAFSFTFSTDFPQYFLIKANKVLSDQSEGWISNSHKHVILEYQATKWGNRNEFTTPLGGFNATAIRQWFKRTFALLVDDFIPSDLQLRQGTTENLRVKGLVQAFNHGSLAVLGFGPTLWVGEMALQVGS